MLKKTDEAAFQPINRGYNSVFRPGRLSLGLVAPIEAHMMNPVPTMKGHLERVRLAEALGFAGVWLRDVPFNVPSFGDAGQIFDPFVYLGMLAGQTSRIALGVASIILPLRHPAHVAKAAASADVLSGGRLLLGVASGDRPEEYPALNMGFHDRGERYRQSVDYIRQMARDYPSFETSHGAIDASMDMLPKPMSGRLPLLVTGGSQQSPDWTARHADGWMTYPRNPRAQSQAVDRFRGLVAAAGEPDKPVMQSLYIDLVDDPEAPPEPIHLGFRAGALYLREHLKALESIGVNHVALNLRFNRADIETTMNRLADQVLPDFSNMTA